MHSDRLPTLQIGVVIDGQKEVYVVGSKPELPGNIQEVRSSVDRHTVEKEGGDHETLYRGGANIFPAHFWHEFHTRGFGWHMYVVREITRFWDLPELLSYKFKVGYEDSEKEGRDWVMLIGVHHMLIGWP